MNNKLSVKGSAISTVLALFLLLGCKPVSLNMQEEKDIHSPSGEEAILSTLRKNNLLGNLNKALFWALKNNQPEVAKWLINKEEVDVNAKDNDKYTLLHWAAYNGHTSVAELLLKFGANVNEKSNDGATPLRCAAYNGQTAVAELLIKSGADVNEKRNNWTALKTAIKHGKNEVAELLRRYGAVE
jgi:ankyrin repeat protein